MTRLFSGIGIAIAAAMLMPLAGANAADMPVKNPPSSPFLTMGADGFYLGVNTMASVAGSSASGQTILNVTPANFTAAGAALGGDVGFIWGRCFLQSWCQVEAGADWQNISGGVPGESVRNNWSVYGEFDVGVQAFQTLIANAPWLNQLNTAFPTLANPSNLLPAAVRVATTPQQYVGVKIQADQLSGQFGGATGESVGVAYGLDTGWRWQTLGTNGQPNGGSLNVQGFVLFADRGVTLNNVFGAGGQPITVGANARQSTIFGAKLQYDIGVSSLYH